MLREPRHRGGDGRAGTLGEFAVAYEEGKLIGVLSGTGGITDVLRAMETALRKETGAEGSGEGAAPAAGNPGAVTR